MHIAVDMVQFVNLLYIALIIPFTIGFNVKMTLPWALVEILSILIQLFVIVMNIRTPVMVKGGATLNFCSVIKYYRRNGLYIDLFAILPLNLILGLSNINNPILKILRVIGAWKSLQIFSQF